IADLRRRLGAEIVEHIAEHDAGAFRAEETRDRRSLPARCPAHQRDLAIESSHVVPPFRRAAHAARAADAIRKPHPTIDIALTAHMSAPLDRPRLRVKSGKQWLHEARAAKLGIGCDEAGPVIRSACFLLRLAAKAAMKLSEQIGKTTSPFAI